MSCMNRIISKPLNAGIIGAGFIGPVHVEGLRRNADIVQVAAIAAQDQQEAQNAALELNVPRAYGNYKELIENPDIDVVHICTPNFLHFTIAKEAMEAGKHVLCEKPLAMTSKEAEQLLELAENSELVTGVHYNLRYYPMVKEMEALIHSGSLGRIFSIHGSYLQDWLLYETDYSWRLEAETSGKSRAVADIGTHWMDLAQMISGLEITEVCADFSVVHPVRKKPLGNVNSFSADSLIDSNYKEYKVDTEDYAAILLHFSNGAVGTLSVSQVAAGRKNRLAIEVDGSEKALAWNSEAPNKLWVGLRGEANRMVLKDPAQLSTDALACSSYPGGHQEGFGETSKNYFSDFYNHILERKQDSLVVPSFPTFRDGLKEMYLCEAITKSAASGKWVKVQTLGATHE